MRIAYACERCRRSKVKCIHEGVPPCHGCLRNGKTENCILSTPATVRRDITTGREKKRPASSHAESPRKVRKADPPDECDIDAILSHPNIGNILEVLAIFRRKFPELGFVHISLGDKSPLDPLTLLAILAAISRFLPRLPQDFSERCAAVLRRELLLQLVNPPNVNTIQALIITALYEWGQAFGYRAWMWTGMAVRMAQSLVAIRVEAPHHNNAITTLITIGEGASETENRTIWSCFVLDRLLSCGSRRPATMLIENLGIPLPVGEQDYAFGSTPATRHTFSDLSENPQLWKAYGTIDQHFSIVFRGINIWSKIHGWVAEGGRRLPGMNEPGNAPWQPGSPWNKLRAELFEWRAMQEERLKYPETKVAIHAHFGHAEVFALTNLIHYLSMIFLHREFIPFLPVAEKAPRGPIDAPLLKATAPAGWWGRNSVELFNAAEQITHIIEEMRSANAPLMIPFAGFCVYTAAAMNLYIAAFPAINHNRSGNAQALGECNIKYLQEFQGLWKIGEDWVNVIAHAQALYQRVSSDRTKFRGKSRRDYVHLENSMIRFGTLDSPSVSVPMHEEDTARGPQQPPPPQPENHEPHLEPAAALLELSSAEIGLSNEHSTLPLERHDDGFRLWSLDLMSLNMFDWMATPEIQRMPVEGQ